SSRKVRASITLRRNTSTAPAMVPSSSLRSKPGIVTSVSPLEIRFITPVIAVKGRDMPRPRKKASAAAASRMVIVPIIRVRCELAEAASYSVECAFKFIPSNERLLGESRSDIDKLLAVEAMYSEVYSEAVLDGVDELLVERNADVDHREAFPVAHDRRHREDAQGIPARFDADDRFARLVRFDHGASPRRNVFAEMLGIVGPVEV